MDASIEVKPRRTAPRAERRQQLIDAAMEVIAEHGLSGTTTAEVTRRAGLSVGLVNHHFESKDNLLVSVLCHLAEELRARWVKIQNDTILSPAEKLEAIVEALFHPEVCTPTKSAVWFAFFGDAGYRESYRATAERYDTERGHAIEDLCRALKDEGGYPEIEPLAVTQSVEGLADGLWLNIMLYPGWVTPEEAKARVMELIAHKFPKHFAHRLPGKNKGPAT